MRRTCFVFVVVVVLACGSRPAATGALRDDAGHVVALEGVPQRIVSLSPAITELLFALGAGDRVVGRTRWGQDPKAAIDVPSVGDGLSPNIEAIVAREPDLVLFYLSPSNGIAIERLTAIGIASASIQFDGLSDLERATRFVGDVVDARPVADSLLADFRMRLATASAPEDGGPRVLMLAWDNPPIAIGAESFLSDIVTRAGGQNVFSDERRPSLPVSIETIVSRGPSVVLVIGVDEPGFARSPEWRTVPAIRDEKFVFVEGTHFAHPSFRAPAAIVQLRRALKDMR